MLEARLALLAQGAITRFPVRASEGDGTLEERRLRQGDEKQHARAALDGGFSKQDIRAARTARYRKVAGPRPPRREPRSDFPSHRTLLGRREARLLATRRVYHVA